ncbi:class I SAM-dependent methyltransferase [Paenibacillus sp. CAU 1782]
MNIKLFPFNRIPSNSNIIIYGAGDIGESFVRQVLSLSYCHIEACVDQKFKEKTLVAGEIRVLNPAELMSFEFDFIVLATQSFKVEMEKFLKNELSIPDEKIIVPQNNECFLPGIAIDRDWSNYYTNAESGAMSQFQNYIKPIFEKYSMFNSEWSTMDFACGRGRIANILKDKYKKIILCDISRDALDYCSKRFINERNFDYIQSEPESLSIESETLDFIYSWDAMVHFNYKMMDIYISEFSRILKTGGYCFIHHSNLNSVVSGQGNSVSDNFHENPHWRSNISSNDIKRMAKRNGFDILEQQVIDWGMENIDCITILVKK